MSSKEATKEVEADEVIAADAKKDAVKGTKRPAEVSCFFLEMFLTYTIYVLNVQQKMLV